MHSYILHVDHKVVLSRFEAHTDRSAAIIARCFCKEVAKNGGNGAVIKLMRLKKEAAKKQAPKKVEKPSSEDCPF